MLEKHVTAFTQIITEWFNSLIKTIKSNHKQERLGNPEPFLHKKSKELKTNNNVRQ